jgi:hypothetical protein
MSTLTPTGSSRRSPLPVVLAVVLALAAGVGGGWWFAGRDKATPTAGPTTTSTCSQHSSAGAHTSASGKPSPGSTTAAKVVLPNPRSIRLNVYNATTRSGLAKTTSLQLQARGFTIVNVANDPLNKTIVGTAQIRFGRYGILAAKVVAAQVPHPILFRDARKDASVDFVIGDAYAALNTPVQAAAVLTAKPTPTKTC